MRRSLLASQLDSSRLFSTADKMLKSWAGTQFNILFHILDACAVQIKVSNLIMSQASEFLLVNLGGTLFRWHSFDESLSRTFLDISQVRSTKIEQVFRVNLFKWSTRLSSDSSTKSYWTVFNEQTFREDLRWAHVIKRTFKMNSSRATAFYLKLNITETHH